MKRKQIFVRALDETGRFGNADIFDLDDESFRAVVVQFMFNANALVGLKEDFVEEPKIQLRLKPGLRHQKD